MMESKPLKRCICGDMVERHKDSNGKYFIYCSNCHLAFGIKLETCQMYYPGTGDAIFDTAEQARLAWNDWTELADLKEEIEYCSGDINEMIDKAEAEERKCFNDVDISYNQGYIEGLREGKKYINRIKFKKEIQAELDKILNGNIVGIEIIDGLPE